MSRYRAYGKSSRSHAGPTLQFDKLLKVCSNSKKPSVTKTAGAIGRFGSASFTSTRNSSFDSPGEDEPPVELEFKRPRLDFNKSYEMNTSLHHGSFGDPHGNGFGGAYGYTHLNASNYLPPPPYNTNPNVIGAAPVIKPRKFFKSRGGPVEAESANPTNTLPPKTNAPVPLAPLIIPVPKLTVRNSGEKTRGRPKGSGKGRRSKEDKPEKHSSSGTVVSPIRSNSYTTFPIAQQPPNPNLTTDHQNNGNINSPIKLRIFKDKVTSTFISVSDTTTTGPLELPQLVPESPLKKERKKPGRKRGSMNTPTPPQALPPPPKGRTTRNSKRAQTAELSGPQMGSSQSTDSSYPSEFSSQNTEVGGSPDFERKEASSKLVKKLEDEDEEFRNLAAMLSSMEDGEDFASRNTTSDHSITVSNPANGTGQHQQQGFPTEIQTHSRSPRELRSILEDEWNTSYDEESPIRPKSSGSSPSKVSRFDGSGFIPDKPEEQHYQQQIPNEQSQNPEQPNQVQVQFQQQHSISEHEQSLQLSPPPQPFNAPHAVRNLLSDFTGRISEPKQNKSEFPKIRNSPRFERITPKVSTVSIPSAPRKSSIFKSRSSDTGTVGEAPNPKKRLALYKHKFGQEAGALPDQEVQTQRPSVDWTDNRDVEEDFEGDEYGEEMDLSVRRVGSSGEQINADGSKVTCRKGSKKLFTVVRNVKAIHELQESGEFHEFDGDVWYILEDLKDKNPITSRCLSAITLAIRCMEPSFRMHLRAHGTVGEFCKELHDAPNHPVLALLAATVLFVLSQDRLNMDLDTVTLQLILALIKAEEHTNPMDELPELSKHRQRVVELVSEMKNRGHAKHLKLEKITAPELSLETLLYLTSKRAGEWVKHELRTLGGIRYIVEEVDNSFNLLKRELEVSGWGELVIERLWKIDRCLRVLQQVTFNHEENQRYLLGAQRRNEDPSVMDIVQGSPEVFVHLFRFFTEHLPSLPRDSSTASTLREILFSVLRVLVNLTHDYRGIVLGSEILVTHDNFIELTLHSIFNLSQSFTDDNGFDLLMHSLCMLLNLVEHSRRNREAVLALTVRPGLDSDLNDSGCEEEIPVLEAFVQMFFAKERAAKEVEAQTDDLLTTNSSDQKDQSQGSSIESSQSKQSQDKDTEGFQEIIDRLIHTAGKNMENCMIAAHMSLLIAYLIMDDPVSADYVRSNMPGNKILPLMVQLKKLFNFMSITSSASGSTRGLKATTVALKFYAQMDPGSNEELKKIIPD